MIMIQIYDYMYIYRFAVKFVRIVTLRKFFITKNAASAMPASTATTIPAGLVNKQYATYLCHESSPL